MVKGQMISVLATMLLFLNSQAQKRLVNTANGTVSGVQQNGVVVFKGIPYAQAPVGALRWKAPQPVMNWKGVRKCDQFGASAMQSKPVPFMMWTEEFISPPEPLSEDCLFLNIWTTTTTASEKRPVIVWIHGGGFTGGAGSCAVYDGAEISKMGIVYVSINYRLGIFGFLAHPELTKESGGKASGNYGFLDQIEALKWVKKNIAAFGGDPFNITIAGQSAGSFSINALVASPLAKGLFHKAIAESGGLMKGRIVKSLSEAEKAGQDFVSQLKVSGIDEARNMSADELQELAGKMPFGSFSPVFDNYVLPADILTYFKQGKHNDVPLLTGWVTGDAAIMGGQLLSAEKYIEQTKQRHGEKADDFLKIFPAGSDEEAKQSQAKLSISQFAGLQSHLWAINNKSASYLYEFSFVPTDKPGFPNYGAFHTSEVPFAFHTLKLWKRPWQERDFAMEKIMSSYWVNFAKTGNPNSKGLPEWKSYNKANGIIMELGEKIEAKPGLFKKEFDFLENL
jgi:para-nitrobenzyl esterase